MIDVDEAKRLILEEAAVLDEVEVGLGDALDRVLAEEILADRDFPPTDRSAMDGFAVRSEDIPEQGTTLNLVGEIRAGQPVGGTRVEPGQSIRIMTGAIVPPGADAVVMVEVTETEASGTRVKIPGPPESGQHIRRRGEDLEAGTRVLTRGSPISGQYPLCRIFTIKSRCVKRTQ